MNEVKFRINPFKVMLMIGQKAWDMRTLDDEYFFEDRYKWLIHTYDNYIQIYKSDKPKDKHKVLSSCAEDIAYLIHQVLRFGRTIFTTDKGVVYNFPKGSIPSFYLNDTNNNERQNTLKENMEMFDYEDPFYR